MSQDYPSSPINLGKIKPSRSFTRIQVVDRVLVCFDTLPLYMTKEGDNYTADWTE
jgi:hypothetical protein